MNSIEQFTGLYSLSKTLRFELKPIGKTQENIEKNGILERDNERAVAYKSVKKYIDEYHKAFIERVMNSFPHNLSDEEQDIWEEALNNYYTSYHLPATNPQRKETLTEAQDTLRTLISNSFLRDRQYKRLFGKELFQEDLAEFVNTALFETYIRSQKGNNNLTEEEVRQIQENTIREISLFRNFTVYFSGYNENRKNMYVADDKATSIANRMITENLPKFVDNMEVFGKIAASEVANHFETLYKSMEAYLNVISIDEMFKLDYYPILLTQKQIDVYNTIIGGKVLEDGSKIQGLNEYVNLYNQQQKDKANRLPKLKPLFKQILSEHNAISWLPDTFSTDNEMLESIEKCYQNLRTQVFEGEISLKKLLDNLGDYDLEHIYIPNDLQLTNIVQKVYGDWSMVKKAMEEDVKAKNPQRKNETGEKYEERIVKILKSDESFSIAQINNLLKPYLGEKYVPLEKYFITKGAEDNNNVQKPNLFIRIENAYIEAKSLLNTQYPKDRTMSQDKQNVERIKILLDAIKDLQHFVKPLLGKGSEGQKDNTFYGEFIPLWEALDQITPLYNMVRNRMTQKPYSDDKIKLFFENNGSFLNGWVDSKTESDNATQYGGYLFRRKNSIGEYDYYLGISSATKLFRSFNHVSESDKSIFERLDYYQLKGKTFYGALYKGDYEKESSAIKLAIDKFITNNGNTIIREKINTEKRKRQPKVSTAIGYLKFLRQQGVELFDSLLKDGCFEESNQAMITSIKATLASMARIPNAQDYAHKDYSLFSDAMDDVEELLQDVIFSYFPISQKEMDKVLEREEKPMYLFKITNKDLSFAETHEKGLRKSRGTDNLHTMYFKALMSGTQNVFDIGSGTVFFRERKIVYSEEQLGKGHHHEMLKDKFDYPIISNKRYAYDKFQFHLSININYKADKHKDINLLVNEYLKESKVTHIIGIDRGERHLLYLSVIDLQGNIVEQYSLNEIVNEYNDCNYRTNYHDLLDIREKQRDEARRSWLTIESIKELKEGYMSQVVHLIAQLIVKYNAIVVLEDLNTGFIRGRQKVEKQVYQKFEKMLIDKLNYLVDKKKDIYDLGGALNALQLTNKFESFQKIGKQCGFLFYVPAWNTSKMDPTTGFVNMLDTRYENMDKAKAFFAKFRSIRQNVSKGWFEFAIDYNDFTSKAAGTKTQWTLCTYGTRIETKRDTKQNNNFVSDEFDLTDKFKVLFNKYNIDVNGNLMEQICSQNDATFFKELLHMLHLTLQMRNSITGTEVDYLISPVMNASGKFYDSRTCENNLPKNADANGAYNIARKGLWIVEQIKHSDNISKLKIAISNKEWLRYTQGLVD
ncbi:MAG: type V CRISPR-associated protein Cas12a/Cpf1 [Bacteroidales bacterium]|nr:type V CRISPR-associated protein Cas12a/Cpf1 [Bacteroidales bacterium]